MSDTDSGDVFDSTPSADANEMAVDAGTPDPDELADVVPGADAAELVSSDDASSDDHGSDAVGSVSAASVSPASAVAASTVAASAVASATARAASARPTGARPVPPKSTGAPKRYTPPKTLAQRKAEEALAKSGASRSEIAAASRAAARTGGTGAYVIPEQGRWVPFVMGACLVIGTLLIVVNYIAEISALGMPSPWYLAAGLVMLVLGFLTATKLR